ncbi:MAG: class C sortase [Ruminococcus sp.]|uniref:class C sortase n=1 Tax=Blautia sp. MSJ-9 TaxID=2841511 RepID=UPI001C0F85F5|nr:class C sortase [Blautia sp. MSJ-9]MBU5679024.1 class C sortase [Blautia sp. MSJ-9]MDD6106564.1 class C sortase [Ruminococcus sp.]
MERKRRKRNKKIKYLIMLILFLIGAGIFLYPTISDMWNQYRNVRLITEYDTSVTDLSKSEYARLWKEAKEYNAEHPVNSIVDAFDESDQYVLTHPYDQVLDPDGNGLMGSIEIPKINVKIAIYHGLGSDILEKGAGHIEGTSLPIGGKNTHAVLAAHRGLPGAKLFTDLDQMEIGDKFYLHILGKTLAYKVDQIKTVLPDQTKALDIVEGEDHVTLLTCTPYGVNTHRLLVRGIRTRYVEEENEKSETVPQKLAQTDPVKLMKSGLLIFILLVGGLWIFLHYRDRKRQDNRSNHS